MLKTKEPLCGGTCLYEHTYVCMGTVHKPKANGCCFPCTRCFVTGSLINLVARELQGCFSPLCSPALERQMQTNRPSCFYVDLGDQIQVLILANKPFTIWVFSPASNDPLFPPVFTRCYHLANAMTAHNLGSAALMFFCRWFLERKTKKHRHCLGHILPSPKIS